jgi:hypothetical protein
LIKLYFKATNTRDGEVFIKILLFGKYVLEVFYQLWRGYGMELL